MKKWKVVLEMDKNNININIDEPNDVGCLFTTVQLNQNEN
jgi:hypothetical protein